MKSPRILSTGEALRALAVVQQKVDSAKTYSELRKLIAEAKVVKATMREIREVREKAELVILVANARAGQEIDKVPKAAGGDQKSNLPRVANSKEGRSALGIPGTSRSRLMKLAIWKEQLPRFAKALWEKGKEATISSVLRDIKNEGIVEKRKQHDARVEKGGKVEDLHALIATGKTFPVIYADPPWKFNVWGASGRGVKGGTAENHYPTMELQDICALPVAGLAAAKAVLFMWTTAPHLRVSFEVLDAWGFEYVTNIVWVKGGQPALGYWVRN